VSCSFRFELNQNSELEQLEREEALIREEEEKIHQLERGLSSSPTRNAILPPPITLTSGKVDPAGTISNFKLSCTSYFI
jgi:hypothetical protein